MEIDKAFEHVGKRDLLCSVGIRSHHWKAFTVVDCHERWLVEPRWLWVIPRDILEIQEREDLFQLQKEDADFEDMIRYKETG